MFEFLKKVYTNELLRAEQTRGDDEHVGQHKAYVMRVYLLYLVGATIFMDKSATYVMSSTYDTSRTLSGFMSITRERLFSLHVL